MALCFEIPEGRVDRSDLDSRAHKIAKTAVYVLLCFCLAAVVAGLMLLIFLPLVIRGVEQKRIKYRLNKDK